MSRRHPPDEFEQLQHWQDFCRDYNRTHRPIDDGKRVLAMFTASALALIIVALLLCGMEWHPGHQDEIAGQYRARRHQAIEVAER